uniref:(California timema) hypothetical protein n=1 Tax=Timema californicum TaxID=61474 RepID=A0A7R9JGF6_TIMCA|nr:unnamed protein product [Timema californicum]
MRTIQSLGMAAEYKDDEQIRNVCRWCAALTYLPVEKVDDAWLIIMENFHRKLAKNLMNCVVSVEKLEETRNCGAVGETSWSVMPGVMKTGAYRYEDGTNYVGDWNPRGQKHGMGHMALPDGTRYDGAFQNGLCSGLVTFSDGSQGFPRNEGYFQDCRLVRKKRCQEVVQRAQKVALMARVQSDQV